MIHHFDVFAEYTRQQAIEGVENETRKIPDGTSKQAVTRREG
jgi:hypothetical protein